MRTPSSIRRTPPVRRAPSRLPSRRRRAHERAATLHAHAQRQLGAELSATYGSGPAGSWLLVAGPQWHQGSRILTADVAGWRRERLPLLGGEPSSLPVVPDWVGEVLAHPEERAQQLPLYAQAGVRHVWLVDPERRTLEVLDLVGTRYALAALHTEAHTVRAEPFGALELPLRLLWAD